MKKISTMAGVALLAMSFGQQALADSLLVDTGTPDYTGSTLALNSGQWLAAEFSTAAATITSINGFLDDNGNYQAGATFTISVYDNNPVNNTPMINSEEYYQQATFNQTGWNGASNLNWQLAAGNYWVAFEVGSNGNNDTFDGIMPTTASNTTLPIAMDYGNYYTAIGGSNFGVQITAVPVPASLWLFASGLLAVGRFGKRKAI
jgi:hypothetical protein